MSHTPDVLLGDIDIVNRAMARIGAPALMTLDDDIDLAQAAQLIYLTEVEAALGKMHWRFARRTRALSRLTETPASGWRYAYELPGDFLGLPEKLLLDPRRPDLVLRDFEIEEGQVHCDADAVSARGTAMVSPQVWPPEFRKAIIVAIAAGLAVPVAHDLTLAASLQREAFGDPREGGSGGLLGRAIAQEVAASPPREDMGDGNILVDARW